MTDASASAKIVNASMPSSTGNRVASTAALTNTGAVALVATDDTEHQRSLSDLL